VQSAAPNTKHVRHSNRKAMNLRAHIKFYGLVLFAAFVLACSPASADKHVALVVVGNSSYKHAPLLMNPANDATAIAGILKSAGFDIVDTRFKILR
jgi:hypothetical protein